MQAEYANKADLIYFEAFEKRSKSLRVFNHHMSFEHLISFIRNKLIILLSYQFVRMCSIKLKAFLTIKRLEDKLRN